MWQQNTNQQNIFERKLLQVDRAAPVPIHPLSPSSKQNQRKRKKQKKVTSLYLVLGKERGYENSINRQKAIPTKLSAALLPREAGDEDVP